MFVKMNKSGLSSTSSLGLLSMALIFQLVTAAGFKSESSSNNGINKGSSSTCIAGRDPSSSSSSSWIFYDCHVRTLNLDFSTTTTSISSPAGGSGSSSVVQTTGREESLFQDVERTRSIRIECNDKLLFESFLAPNQSLFRLVNLRQVEIKSCKIRRIPGLLWAKLPLLRTLSLQTRNNHWSSSVSLDLDSGAFLGLGQLETLDLSYNNIWSVPESLFCPLRSLVKLNMSHNRLSELEEFSSVSVNNASSSDYSSCELNKLQVIDLSYNSLRSIAKVSPAGGLKELRLENNLIEQIEDSALSGLRELKFVNLSSNRLVALPPSIFSHNVNLRELYLANNSLSAISPAVFSRLDQLIVLDLSRNMLTSQWIRERMFHGLIRLVILRLSFNHLSSLEASIFQDLGSLQALYVDNNRIETIRPDAFGRLANLHVLDLSNNKLSTLDPRLFSGLFVLQQLYLDHNKIRQMDEATLKNCTALQDLGLAGNLLQEVPVALRGLTRLRSLDIGENRIFSLTNDSFFGLSQLYGLRMVDNRLSELPPGFCGPLKSLRVLNLAQNRLERISSSALLACPQLRALRLDSNSLEELAAGTLTPQLPSLLWLNVSCNRVKSADWRQLPPSLEWLDLSHNALQSFSSSGSRSSSGGPSVPLNHAYHLRVLDLSYNNLTVLDSGMIPPSLETIRMNYNKLNRVADGTFSNGRRLRRVELVGNLLQVLPLNSIKLPGGRGGGNSNLPFSSLASAGGRRSSNILAEFYLGGNPFHCDCRMEWLTRTNQHYIYAQQQQQQGEWQYPRVVDLDGISCHFPHPPRVVALNEASSEDFLCSYESVCGAGCHCCEFDACDCAMRCPKNCSCSHDFAWSRNVIRCSGEPSHIKHAIPDHLPMNATEIYLDGNKVGRLGSHSFIGKAALRTLWLNDSGIEFIRNKTFNGLRSLEILRLEDNLLTALHGYEFADLGNLRELYLQNNLLGFIAPDTFAPLKLLRDLRLDGNLLISFSPATELSSNLRLSRFLLARNPWSCACEFISSLRSFFLAPRSLVTDFPSAKCQEIGGGEQSEHVISSLCQSSSGELNYYENEILNGNNNIAPLLSSSGGSLNLLPSPLDGLRTAVASNGETGTGNEVLWTLTVCSAAILLLILLVVLIFRREIYHRVLLNDRLNPLCFSCASVCSGKKSACSAVAGTTTTTSAPTAPVTSSVMDECEKLFDAYFLYSKRDEEMVLEKIAPELEHHCHHSHHHQPHRQQDTSFFRLCLHYRDLCLSAENPWNPEMVLSAADASKRVVLLLSRTLLHSEWTNMEFRTTIQNAISRHHRKFIVILLPCINQQCGLESFTATCPLLRNKTTKKNTTFPACLEWTDENFWSKLKQLFPPPTVRISTLNGVGRHNNCLHNFQQHYHHSHRRHHHPHPPPHHHPRNAIALPPIPSSSSSTPDLALPHGITALPPTGTARSGTTSGTTTTTTPATATRTSIISHSKKTPSYPLPNIPITSTTTKLVPTSDPQVFLPSGAGAHFHSSAAATATNSSHDDHFYSTLLHEFPTKQPQQQHSGPDVIPYLNPTGEPPPPRPRPGSTAIANSVVRRSTDNGCCCHGQNNVNSPSPRSSPLKQMNLSANNSSCQCRDRRSSAIVNSVNINGPGPIVNSVDNNSHRSINSQTSDTQNIACDNSTQQNGPSDSTNIMMPPESTDKSGGGSGKTDNNSTNSPTNGPTYFV